MISSRSKNSTNLTYTRFFVALAVKMLPLKKKILQRFTLNSEYKD